MKHLVCLFSIILGVAVAVSSCKKVEIPDDTSGISFETTDVFVGYTNAKVFGTIRVYERPERISRIEVVYAKDAESLKTATALTGKMDSEKSFAIDIPTLEDGAEYYYQARIIVGKTPVEGKIQSFITFPQGPVDLDLPSGVKWASHNVGAQLPTETGSYFAWGETKAKDQYDWSSYQYCNGDPNKLTKYITRSTYSASGNTDNIVVLLPSDDAAKAVGGSSLRTPTIQEFEELLEHCVKTPATINGVYGIKFSSKADMNNNKKFIFLNAVTGYYSGTDRVEVVGSYYWSSTVNSNVCSGALNLYVTPTIAMTDGGNRCFGEVVRGVYEK